MLKLAADEAPRDTAPDGEHRPAGLWREFLVIPELALFPTSATAVALMSPKGPPVVVSVPGSDSHVEILGAPVLHRYSLPSLIDGTGLSICVTSRADTIDVCAIGDRSLVPDLQSLVDGFVLELDALISG